LAERGPKPGQGERPGAMVDFQDAVDRYAGDLYRLARSLVRTAEDAEDLVQETYLAAYAQLGRFEGRSTLKTWLIGILTRKAARHHRYYSIRKTLSFGFLGESDQEEFDRKTASNPGQDLRARMDIGKMLDTLNRKHREIFVLREVAGLSYQEIGEALGIPVGTVESRLFRARQELREKLEDYRR